MKHEDHSLKPFLRFVRMKQYSNRLDEILNIVQDVTTNGCLGFWAYSDRYSSHDRIIIGAKNDVLSWCQANKVDLGHSWLYANLGIPAHKLSSLISTDILGENIVNDIAETLKLTSKLAGGMTTFQAETILDKSLEDIVEHYLCRSIVWATTPMIDHYDNFSECKKYKWFREWTTKNNTTKPSWTTTPHQPQQTDTNDTRICGMVYRTEPKSPKQPTEKQAISGNRQSPKKAKEKSEASTSKDAFDAAISGKLFKNDIEEC